MGHTIFYFLYNLGITNKTMIEIPGTLEIDEKRFCNFVKLAFFKTFFLHFEV